MTHPNWAAGFHRHILCPHCGEEDHERAEYPRVLKYDGDRAVTECDHCGKPIKVTVCVTYEYATEPAP
jgi:uncharacterized Zn finger protein